MAHFSSASRAGRWTSPRILPVGAAFLLLVLAADVALMASFPDRFWRLIDVELYRVAGQQVWHSEPLYDALFLEERIPFTYTPFAGALLAPISVVPLTILKFLFTAVSVLSLVGAAWYCWGILGYRSGKARAGAALGAAGLGLCLEPVQDTLSFGQINLILMCLVLADFAAPDDRRWKGLGIGLAAAVKLTPAIFIGYLLLTRRLRAAAVATGAFAAAIGAGFVLLPGESKRYWIDRVFADADRVGPPMFMGNQSLNGVWVRLARDVAQAEPIWLATAAGTGLAGMAVAVWAGRRGHELAGVLLCAVTGLLVSPISWEHHWVWVVPAFVLLIHAGRRAHRARPWVWAGLALLLLAFCWPGIIWGVPYDGTPTGVTYHPEYYWQGADLVIGNLYVILGAAALAGTGLYALLARRGPAPESPAPLPILLRSRS